MTRFTFGHKERQYWILQVEGDTCEEEDGWFVVKLGGQEIVKVSKEHCAM